MTQPVFVSHPLLTMSVTRDHRAARGTGVGEADVVTTHRPAAALDTTLAAAITTCRDVVVGCRPAVRPSLQVSGLGPLVSGHDVPADAARAA